MNIEDLQYIFKSQIEEGTDKLYFMLVDGADTPTIQRHPLAEIETLLPLLDSFHYTDSTGKIPRFSK
jgi:hypothetical protein